MQNISGIQELNNLHQQRHILIREFDRKDISEDEYKQKIILIEQQIKEINAKISIEIKEQLVESLKEDEERRNTKMAEEIKEVKEKKVGAPKGPRKESYASVILDVLQMKTVKSIDVAADKVLEKKPGRAKASVKAQIGAMIGEVKKGKKPAYTWDEEEFQLNEK